MRNLGILIVCMVVLLASVAVAQPMDKLELSFAAGFAKIGDGDHDMSATYLVGQAGKMVTPNVQLSSALVYANAGGIGNAWAIAPAASYYFNKDVKGFVPYVGAGFYFARGSVDDDSENETGFHWLIGAKSFLGQDPATADRALFVEYRSIGNVVEDIDLSSFMIGISNYF